MKRAGLDNHILIWAIRGVAEVGQETMIRRAKLLLEELEKEQADIVIPAVVVSEFLTGVPKPQHTELLRVLSRRFQLPPFDVRAAAVAATIWRDNAEKNPELREQIRETFPGVERAKIKADIQIIATCVARNVDVLFSHDGPLRTLAKGTIEVRELPPLKPTQPDLFVS
jgi:predicted nucleic acid-binding protein